MHRTRSPTARPSLCASGTFAHRERQSKPATSRVFRLLAPDRDPHPEGCRSTTGRDGRATAARRTRRSPPVRRPSAEDASPKVASITGHCRSRCRARPLSRSARPSSATSEVGPPKPAEIPTASDARATEDPAGAGPAGPSRLSPVPAMRPPIFTMKRASSPGATDRASRLGRRPTAHPKAVGQRVEPRRPVRSAAGDVSLRPPSPEAAKGGLVCVVRRATARSIGSEKAPPMRFVCLSASSA